MSTGIFGGIEHRHPGVDAGHLDADDAEPWVKAVDLWPLYDQSDYAAFGCLFGVRNDAGFRPLAARRGLPDDVSSVLRAELKGCEGASWVGWAELARLDPATAPDHFAGRLSLHPASARSPLRQLLVPALWPADVLAEVGPPPAGLSRSTATEWTAGDVRCTYEPLTAGYLLGGGTHWPHVFAVMKAPADRHGEEAVRLVVAFD
ncbi:hypothetical protein [Kitasatospora sp. CB01950]|uniref:hypothetical protein n=1 Tax=Kitasatospora sp. CB01950 TaxID=1703930 RepID=UPI000938DDBF|nr:hypothetical protein [Kitasatospora sp. CB01950]